MEKSAVLEIFRTFSKEDFARFQDLAKSPFYNKNSNVTKLCAALKKASPDFDADKISKENLWKALFPKKEYNYGTMKNLIFDLTKLAENYLASIYSFRDGVYDKNLIAGLRQRKLTGLHKKNVDKLNKKIENQTKDEDYYSNKIQLIQELTSVTVDKKLSDEINVECMSHDLNLFMMRLFSSSLNLFIEEQRTNIRHDNKTTLYFLDYFTRNIEDFKNEEVLLIYYHMLLASINPDSDNDYAAASNIFRENVSRLDYTEQWNINNALTTICIKKKDLYPLKSEDCQREMLRLAIEKISLVEEHGSGYIDILTYRNVLVLYSLRKEGEALGEFIGKFIHKIDIPETEAIENYSNAFVSFVKGDFKKCLECCSKINFKDLFDSVKGGYWFKKDVKSFEVRCYYELDLFENFLTAADSYKHFLINSSLMNDSSKSSDLNFIKQLNRLFLLKLNGNVAEVPGLRDDILSIDNLFNKAWLLEKANELISVT